MKKDLTYLNTTEILQAEFSKTTLVELGIFHNSQWILPQILAKIAQVKPKVSAQGDYLFSDLFELWKTQEILELTSIRAWLKILNHTVRGEILSVKQSSSLGSRYSQGVPLLLSAYKQFHSIDYNRWNYTDPIAKHLVPPDILELTTLELEEITREELLEFRDKALYIRTGKQAGATRDPLVCVNSFAVTDPRIAKLPKLARLQLLDLWIYHPSIRNPYLFWIGNNPDQAPEPLINQEVIVLKPRSTVPELDWG